jgi:hypothetical protein
LPDEHAAVGEAMQFLELHAPAVPQSRHDPATFRPEIDPEIHLIG